HPPALSTPHQLRRSHTRTPLLVFSFASSPHHRDLHSFPTRRSSDLRHYGTVILPTRPAMPRHKGKVEAGVKYAQNNAVKGRNFEDRKSTRLNSSHQIISYAVFCLKKKTQSTNK